MVAFASTDLPASINTVEKLAAWSLTVLNHLHPELTTIEATGTAQLVATASPFFITATEPNEWRYITRGSFRLNSNWQRGASKVWANIEDLSNQSIPTEFKS